MSSVTSQMAQIGRRINYFRVSADCSGYTIDPTTDYNGWKLPVAAVNYSASAGTILQDMGEIAKYGGQIFRKVRAVTQIPGGGTALAYFIVVPGGEYPVQGISSTTGTVSTLPVAQVARLG